MANVTIYLDDALAGRVRAAKLPISRICQQALRAEVTLQELLCGDRDREQDTDGQLPDAGQ